MIIPEEVKSDFAEVPEEIIKKGAEMFGGNQNHFTQLLVNANMYRKAGLEPIYLINSSQTLMLVSSRETWDKKLH